MNDLDNRHGWLIRVPCPECFAHTGELCKEGLNYMSPAEVHRQREYEARNAIDRTVALP